MTQPQSRWHKLVGGFRIVTTRVVAVLATGLLLVSSHNWPEGGVLDVVLELAGMVLIVLGTFGRLWCTLFIAGYKTKQLITVGPFSMVRNPLYLFSFIAAMGVAMCAEMVTFMLLVALLFAIYYPTVILLEEQKLRALHGPEFDEYCRRVPRVFPKLSLYQEPETYEFSPRLFRKAFWDGIWFILVYPALALIERLHELGWLPVFLKLY